MSVAAKEANGAGRIVSAASFQFCWNRMISTRMRISVFETINWMSMSNARNSCSELVSCDTREITAPVCRLSKNATLSRSRTEYSSILMSWIILDPTRATILAWKMPRAVETSEVPISASTISPSICNSSPLRAPGTLPLNGSAFPNTSSIRILVRYGGASRMA